MARSTPSSDPFVAEPGPAPPGPGPRTDAAGVEAPGPALAALALAPAPEAPPAPPALTEAEATLFCRAELTLRYEALAQELAALAQAQRAHAARLITLEAKAAAPARPGAAAPAAAAPVLGAAQAEHDCPVVDAAGQAHGPCRLNRFGHCPKCYNRAMFDKSRAA